MPKAVYIHIPFCKTHCPYCDFAVYLDNPRRKGGSRYQNYTDALCHEISSRTPFEEKEILDSIYFGGGTPSILPLEMLEQIFETLKENFVIHQNTEITLETNPGTVDEQKLVGLKNLGVNRLSIGVQTFDPQILPKLARGHTLADSLEIVELAQSVGFTNISIDLIFGLPKQTVDSWKDTLEKACDLAVQHISCYLLTIEEGTPFQKLYQSQKSLPHPDLPSEEVVCAMYDLMCSKLSEKGFDQYEVSNFAKRDFKNDVFVNKQEDIKETPSNRPCQGEASSNYQSKHNLTYWRNHEFYGFGVAAHEYKVGKRKAHSRDLEAYLKDPISQEELDCDPKIEDLMLGLRLREGIDLEHYKSVYGVDLIKEKGSLMEDYKKRGLIEVDLETKRLNISQKGFLMSTQIISNLI
ncbi:MAG: radical SAM family heme chaperone HemW [Candidatus Caenarcaniphilales bacterium]|nr:radical SAM family heme chaperone HemW [Candidatus Caenarcaniphilales bacterium]